MYTHLFWTYHQALHHCTCLSFYTPKKAGQNKIKRIGIRADEATKGSTKIDRSPSVPNRGSKKINSHPPSTPVSLLRAHTPHKKGEHYKKKNDTAPGTHYFQGIAITHRLSRLKHTTRETKTQELLGYARHLHAPITTLTSPTATLKQGLRAKTQVGCSEHPVRRGSPAPRTHTARLHFSNNCKIPMP